LDHKIHTGNGIIFHCTLESFLSEKCKLHKDINLNVTFPIIKTGRGISLEEAFTLCVLVRAISARRCFEIGTFHGWSTFLITSAMGEGGKTFTIDLPPDAKTKLPLDRNMDCYELTENDVGRNFSQHIPHGTEIVQLYGDSATFDFSPWEKTIDLVFIDGAHSNSYVLNDTIQAFKVVRDGGLIIWHDFKASCPGLIRALKKIGKDVDLMHIEGTSLVVCVKESTIFQQKR
jgi:predicted O-methyltransferase YrrM